MLHSLADRKPIKAILIEVPETIFSAVGIYNDTPNTAVIQGTSPEQILHELEK
jgi:hypothetical protein